MIKVELETTSDLRKFVEICEKFPYDVFLVDAKHSYRVSAKSTLGLILAKTEWESIYCTTLCNDKKYENWLESMLRRNNLTAR